VGVSPAGVTFAGGSLYVADGSSVRMVSPATGQLTTPAGDGASAFSADGGAGPVKNGIPATAEALAPADVAVDGSGNVVIAAEENNRVRVVAATTGTFYGQPMTAGDIYTVAGDGADRFSGDGGPATKAGLEWPSSVAVDAAGDLIIADSYSNRVRTVAG
jgi:hypothetical protein